MQAQAGHNGYNATVMNAQFCLKARWILPVAAPPIENGTLTVEDGRIVAVGRAVTDCEVTDLGDVIILPGLVNAHTHLEFSDLDAPLGESGMALPDWIRRVMAYRAARDESRDAVACGIDESLRAGTTALGDILTHDWRHRVVAARRVLPQMVAFWESIAPTGDRVMGAASQAEAFLSGDSPTPRVRAAISPHAPYTVHRELLQALVAMSRQHNVAVTMHLAESPEELEFLKTGQGPFRDLLAEVGALDPKPKAARYPTNLDYLEQLADAPRSLVVHGNYLSDEETGFLAARSDRMSVVYCPRTHTFFEHDAYPLAQLLERGLAVALGTDSRASNPDLGILAEMQQVRQRHGELPGETIVAMGTLCGARALGFSAEMGSLEPGKLANLAVVSATTGDDNPYDAVLDRDARVVATYLHGTRIDSAVEGDSRRAGGG